MKFVSLMADNMDFFYTRIVECLSRRSGMPIQVDHRVPWRERERMLNRGEAEIGVICGLSYVSKVDRSRPLVELLAAPVMRQPRYGNRTIYFSDVIVRTDSPFRTFADLCGATWAYNEPGSHSGYNLTRCHLASRGERSGFFGRVVESGAHQLSIQMVLDGRVEASAIDSTVLELELKLRPHLGHLLSVIHTIGPSPIPPMVVSTAVPRALRLKLKSALGALHEDAAASAVLAGAGISRFVCVRDADYDPIRQMARAARGVELGRVRSAAIGLPGIEGVDAVAQRCARLHEVRVAR